MFNTSSFLLSPGYRYDSSAINLSVKTSAMGPNPMSPANVMDLSGPMGTGGPMVTSPHYPGPGVSPCYSGPQLVSPGSSHDSQHTNQTLDLSLARAPGSLRCSTYSTSGVYTPFLCGFVYNIFNIRYIYTLINFMQNVVDLQNQVLYLGQPLIRYCAQRLPYGVHLKITQIPKVSRLGFQGRNYVFMTVLSLC